MRVEMGKDGGVSQAPTPGGIVSHEVALDRMVDYGFHDLVALEVEHEGVEEGTGNNITGGRYIISPPRGDSIVAEVLGRTQGGVSIEPLLWPGS